MTPIKALLISVLPLLSFEKNFAQTLVPQVDKRVEITSIIFRLAGNPEYNQEDALQYVKAIHSHFDRFRDDSVISFAQSVRDKYGVSYDAVMSMAVSLRLSKNTFTLKEGWEQSLDNRWRKETAMRFVELLNAFYAKSEADQFFLNEAAYYDKVSDAFNKVLSNFNQSWYYQYYGLKPKETFNVIIGCGNGGGNYGRSTNSPGEGKQIYAIVGSWSFDGQRNPIFRAEDYLPTLIHEFNHSFINPLTDQYKTNKILEVSATTLLDTMRTEMSNQAYQDWLTLVNESLVRASVIRYLMANDSTGQKVREETILQTNKGFLWVKDLVSLLDVYEKNRTKYKTLADFYPEAIKFFQSAANTISLMKSNYQNMTPRVVSIEPFPNNSQNVDTSFKEVTINFSQVMTGKGYSFNYGSLGKDALPITGIIGYTNSNKSFKITVILKADKEYEFVVTGLSFKNLEGYPLKDYTIKFKTRK